MTDQPQPADLSDESNEGLLTAYFRNGMTFAVTADAEERRHVNARGADIRAELESRLSRADAPGVTVNEHQAELIVDIVTRYRDEVDAAGLQSDLTDILATMHMHLAALAGFSAGDDDPSPLDLQAWDLGEGEK